MGFNSSYNKKKNLSNDLEKKNERKEIKDIEENSRHVLDR